MVYHLKIWYLCRRVVIYLICKLFWSHKKKWTSLAKWICKTCITPCHWNKASDVATQISCKAMPSVAGCHKNHNLVGISGLCSENQRGLWRRLEIQRNETASEVNSTCTSAIMQTCCLVSSLHYSMLSMHFGSRGHVSQPFVLHTSQKCIDREGLGRHRTGTGQAFSGQAR